MAASGPRKPPPSANASDAGEGARTETPPHVGWAGGWHGEPRGAGGAVRWGRRAGWPAGQPSVSAANKVTRIHVYVGTLPNVHAINTAGIKSHDPGKIDIKQLDGCLVQFPASLQGLA